MARPTSAALSPPGSVLACTEKTGRIRNRPSMRKAKIEASEALALTSARLMPLLTSLSGREDGLFMLSSYQRTALRRRQDEDPNPI